MTHRYISHSPNSVSLMELLEVDDSSVPSLEPLRQPPIRPTTRSRGNIMTNDRLSGCGGPFMSSAHLPEAKSGEQRPRETNSSVSSQSSKSSLDTEALLNYVDDFALSSPHHHDIGNGTRDRTMNTDASAQNKTNPILKTRAAFRMHDTPRLDNRRPSRDRANKQPVQQVQHQDDDVDGSENRHPISSHGDGGATDLHEWLLRWRSAVQTWVEAQKYYQERQHTSLKEQLHREIQHQQATIAELYDLVESQQELLQKFLASQSSTGNMHQQNASQFRGVGDGAVVTEAAHITNPKTNCGHKQAPQRRVPTSTSSLSTRLQPRYRERLPNGTRVTIYANGTRKEQLDNGGCVIHFDNGDIQTIGRDGKTAYWFASTQVVKVEGKDCTMYQFPNGQVERHYSDGTKFVQFSNHRSRWIDA